MALHYTEELSIILKFCLNFYIYIILPLVCQAIHRSFWLAVPGIWSNKLLKFFDFYIYTS